MNEVQHQHIIMLSPHYHVIAWGPDQGQRSWGSHPLPKQTIRKFLLSYSCLMSVLVFINVIYQAFFALFQGPGAGAMGILFPCPARQ